MDALESLPGVYAQQVCSSLKAFVMMASVASSSTFLPDMLGEDATKGDCVCPTHAPKREHITKNTGS